MSFNFGGSSKQSSGTTTVSIPGPTKEESALTSANAQLAQEQLNALRQQQADQQAFQASPLGQMQSQVEEAVTKNLLARATGAAPILTPEQQASLDQMFGLTEKRATQALQQYAQEEAAARGMSVADSPIGNESLRQAANLQEGLAATKTNAALNLGQSQDLFNQNLASFTNQLRQQAYQNRLAFATSNPASYNLQNMLLAQRAPNQTRTASGSSSGFNWGGSANGQQAGSLLQGLGGL